MRLIPIQDITQLEDGEPVPSVRARITAVWPRNAGTNDRGDYSFQNIDLEDATGKIKAKLKDREEFPKDWKGKEVVIACNSGDKGLTGVKATDDEYKGKTSRILWVTKSAHIDLAGDVAAPAAKPQTQQASAPAAPRPSAPASHAPAPANGNGHANGQLGPKQKLFAMASLYVLCLKAADFVDKRSVEERETRLTDEHYQACVASLFIQATREGLHEQLTKEAAQ